MLRTALWVLAFASWLAFPSAPRAAAASIDDFAARPRVFVLTDIGNEPDDQMSMVRLLLYSNELEIEGLIATTSTWRKEYPLPEHLLAVIDAYAEVQAILGQHAPGWPAAEQLRALVHNGPEGYGLAATDARKPSAGARALLDRIIARLEHPGHPPNRRLRVHR